MTQLLVTLFPQTSAILASTPEPQRLSMRVWTVTFLLVFLLAELYQWLEGIVPPFPVFIGAGALLAIASNSGKWPLMSSSTPAPPTSAPSKTSQPAPQMPPKLNNTKGLNASETPELPKLETPSKNPFFEESSISFTIPKRSPD